MTTEIFQWTTVILLGLIWITFTAAIISSRTLLYEVIGLGHKISWLGGLLGDAQSLREVISVNVGRIDERLAERYMTRKEREDSVMTEEEIAAYKAESNKPK